MCKYVSDNLGFGKKFDVSDMSNRIGTLLRYESLVNYCRTDMRPIY